MNHYPQVKNEANRLLAKKNSEKYGFFTFANGLAGKCAIISATKTGSKIDVLYMHESELEGEFIDGVFGDYFKLDNDALQYYNLNQSHTILTNRNNFIQFFRDTFNIRINNTYSLVTKQEKQNQDSIKVANEIIERYKNEGLDNKMAERVTLITIEKLLETGLGPMDKSKYQKTYNYLYNLINTETNEK